MTINRIALESIQAKLRELPDSKVIDRNVVVDHFLDLQQELLSISEEPLAAEEVSPVESVT